MNLRAFLIEFVIVDRFHCGLSFPYIQGILKENKVETMNVRFGLKSAYAMLEENGNGATLPLKDLSNMIKIIDTFKPTHILFSHKPAHSIMEAVKKMNGVEAGYWTDSGDKVKSSDGEEKDFFQWMKFKNPGDIFGFEKPDFSCYAGNREANDFRPLPHLMSGGECNYNKSILENPYFKELDLSGSVRQGGCTFCMRPDSRDENVDSFARVKKQLKQAYETCRWGEHRPRYRIFGEKIYYNPEKFAEIIKELCLTQSDFLLNCRADYVVKYSKRLENLVKTIKRDGNRIQLCLIGIENFSQDELDRMNKGIITETIIKMVGILRELEKKYPENFDYKEYGGLSTILYTPWTRLEDIEFNLALVEHLGLENLCGKLLTSRLRLYAELPLTKLAEKDGLLMDEYEDAFLNTAKRNFYADEIPWRFKDQRAELFNKFALRLKTDDALIPDGLYKFVQEWHKKLPVKNKTEISVAKLILNEIKNGPLREDIPEVLEKISQKAKDINFTQSFPISHFSYGITGAEYILMQKHIRKVGRMENVPVQSAGAIALKLKEVFGGKINVLNVYELRSLPSKDGCDIFYGFNTDEINEAVRLTKIIQEESFGKVQKQAAVEKVGVLLGYPECCAKSYAHSDTFEWHYNEWIYLKHRIEKEGEVLPETNPFTSTGLKYVTCSLECRNTINLLHLLRDEFTLLKKEKFVKETKERCKKPVFSLLDTAGCFVVLETRGEPFEDEMFYYKAVQKAGDDARLDHVMKGDSMLVKKGWISVFSKGKKIYDFILNAYVWWYKKAFHAEFYKLCIHNEYKELTDQLSKVDGGGFFKEVKHNLSKVQRIFTSKTGFKIKDIMPCGTGVKLSLENGNENIEVFIEPVEKAEMPSLLGKYYALTCNEETNIHSQNKIKNFKLMVKVLDALKDKVKSSRR